jgi:hypothetical protein
MKRLAVAVGVSISIVCFAGSVNAQWRYTDDKGNSKTVTLKMDVPAQYVNGAVYVGGDSNSAPAPRAPEAVAAPVGEQKPLVLVPGAMWWQYPVGSPERAAVKAAAEQRAAELRTRATAAGAPDPAVAAPARIPSSSGYSAAAAEQDAAKRAKDFATCQALVNRQTFSSQHPKVPGSQTFKADAASGLTYGTDAARFEFEACMARQ